MDTLYNIIQYSDSYFLFKNFKNPSDKKVKNLFWLMSLHFFPICLFVCVSELYSLHLPLPSVLSFTTNSVLHYGLLKILLGM